MARTLNRLSARAVVTLSKPGRHSDGGGLYLRITDQGSRSWVFMAQHVGKRREIGLGATSSIGLAAARKIAADMREAIAFGKDPRSVLEQLKPVPATPVETFGSFSKSYITNIEHGWKNLVHRRQWRQSLADHAAALSGVALPDIDTALILEVLRPIWMTKPETASRVRGRIERIIDAAKAQGLRPIDSSNPARFRGHLELLLPKQPKFTRGHHPALDWKLAPAFMVSLRERAALSARALEFTILTVARSGETLGATWGEVDFGTRQWKVPAARMKAGEEHIVPLSTSAIALLESLRPIDPHPHDRIFAVGGAPRSNMAMSALLKRMDHSDITTHGFRSTFRDWAGDATDYPRELIEQALAHTIGNKAERAYRRGTAVEKRRELMEAWAGYLASSSQRSGEVEVSSALDACEYSSTVQSPR